MKIEKKLTINNVPVELHSVSDEYKIYRPINVDWEYPTFYVTIDEEVKLRIDIECDMVQGFGVVDKAIFTKINTNDNNK